MKSLVELCDSIALGELQQMQAEDNEVDIFSGTSVTAWGIRLKNAISASDMPNAVHLLTIGLLRGGSAALGELRRHGRLRASRDYSKTEFLATLVKSVTASTALELPASAVQYLGSLQLLYELAIPITQLRKDLLARLKQLGPNVLDGLLRTVELIFLGQSFERPVVAIGRTPEARAEGLSDLWMLAVESGLTLQLPDIPTPDTKGVVDGLYLHLIDSASPLRKFVEWERLVDLLDYEISKERRGRIFRVRARNSVVEKSIRLGFIYADQQKQLRQLRADTMGAASLELIVERLDQLIQSKVGHGMVEHVLDPYPRFRVHLPNIPELLALLGDRRLYADEVPFFRYLTEEFAASPEEIQDLKLKPGLTVWDVLVVQRLITVVRLSLMQYLEPLFGKDNETLINSLLPRLTKEMSQNMLGPMIGESAAKLSLSFLSWDQAPSFFDLQYQPVIRAGNGFVLPTAVLGLSNLVRSAMQIAHARIALKTDPAEAAICKIIEVAGGHAKPNVEYRAKGQSWETDVIGRLDDVLIVCEIKRALLPTNQKELQSTLDVAFDAAGQLDRFLSHWRDKFFQKYLMHLLDWPQTPVRHVCTCIVLTNRMLPGGRIDGHPIRGLHEFGSFLTSGTATIGSSEPPGEKKSVEVTAKYWNGDRLTGDDIVAYLQDDIIHRDVFASMKRFDTSYSLGKTTLIEESYLLDSRLLIAKLRERTRAHSAERNA
jgi:hypothetical protein